MWHKVSNHKLGVWIRHSVLAPQGHHSGGEQLYRAGFPVRHGQEVPHHQAKQAATREDLQGR